MAGLLLPSFPTQQRAAAEEPPEIALEGLLVGAGGE